jgi:hypothetical protein
MKSNLFRSKIVKQMKIKRKEILRSIENSIRLINQNINHHDIQRKSNVNTNEKEAAYHCGRCSALFDAIAYLEIISDQLKEK